jgi:hypothetical protein
VALGDQRGEGWMHEALARIDLQRGEREAALANQMRARGIALRLGDHELLAASDALTISIPVAQEG